MTSHYSLNPKLAQRAVDQLQAIIETYMAHLKQEANGSLAHDKCALLREINAILTNATITPECKLAELFLAEESRAIFNDVEKLKLLAENSQRSFVSSQFWKIINDVRARCGFPRMTTDIPGVARTQSMFDLCKENIAGTSDAKNHAAHKVS